MPPEFSKSARNSIHRIPSRGHYDHSSVYSILDAAFLCHVGFVVDGQPFVIPTAYGRKDNRLFFHGSVKSRMAMELGKGMPVCITVTLLDGIVLARSAFHHSMNYRSVVLFGKASEITNPEEKEEALRVISEQILPGRWEEVRPPNANELKATAVLELNIDEASAKIREGGPKDDREDYQLPIWAGVLPIIPAYLNPEKDSLMELDLDIPPSVRRAIGKDA